MQRLKDWLLAITIAIAVAAVVGSLEGGPDVPDTAPDFALPSPQGETISLAALRGQTVIVNFWASWCGPCRQEIPEFSRFAHDHPEITVLGLAVESGEAREVSSSARRLGIDYPVALADSATVRAYDISAFPTTIVVGPDGQVQHVQVGAMSYAQLQRATGL